jgi:hypothetical protein
MRVWSTGPAAVAQDDVTQSGEGVRQHGGVEDSARSCGAEGRSRYGECAGGRGRQPGGRIA